MNEKSQIPSGWVKTNLEDCVDILDYLRIPINSQEREERISGKELQNLYPYYGATGQVGNIDGFLFDEEILLLGEDGAPFLDSLKNKAYLIQGKSWVNNHAHVLRAKSGFTENLFLMHYLNFFDYHDYVTGTTRLKLNQAQMRRIPVFLPPLDEQERIVAKIETLFSQLDSGVASLKRIQAALKRYRASVLKAAFEGKLVPQDPADEPATGLLEELFGAKYLEKIAPSEISILPYVPPGWAFGKLENLIYIAGRIGWRGLKAEEYTLDGPLFLSVFNLNKGDYIDFTDVHHISIERYDESPEIQLRENDILLTKDGAGIGKIGIVKNLPGKATVNSSLLVIRASKIFIPEFLFYFLKGPQMQDVVRARVTGSATPHLFQRDIKQFTLLIPPLIEQKKIVIEIEQRLSVLSEVEKMITAQLAHSHRLRQTILKSAFEGRLVSQNNFTTQAPGEFERNSHEDK